MNQWINTFNSSMDLTLNANGLLSNETTLSSCKAFQITGSQGSCIFKTSRVIQKHHFLGEMKFCG